MSDINETNTPNESVKELTPAEKIAEARRTIFNSESAKQKTVTFNYHGVELEWRQPQIESVQRANDETDAEDRNFMVLMLIQNSYLPGTDERIFSMEDYDTICKMPLNGDFRNATSRIADILDLRVDEKVKN